MLLMVSPVADPWYWPSTERREGYVPDMLFIGCSKKVGVRSHKPATCSRNAEECSGRRLFGETKDFSAGVCRAEVQAAGFWKSIGLGRIAT